MSAPLEGIRVIDVTNVSGGAVLRLSAGDSGRGRDQGGDAGDRRSGPAVGRRSRTQPIHMGASFLAQNAGKRSITINLKSDGGKAIFRRLVETADVVVENFRPGVMDRLGVGYKVVKLGQSAAGLLRAFRLRSVGPDEGCARL